MRSVTKDSISRVLGKEVNNEKHAIRLLEMRLEELNASDLINVADGDVRMLLEFLEAYDKDVEFDEDFWDRYEKDLVPKRKGESVDFTKKSTVKSTLEKYADSVCAMHEGMSYSFKKTGITFIKNGAICSTREWRKVTKDTDVYSAETWFMKFHNVEEFKEVAPARFLEDAYVDLHPQKGHIRVKHLSTIRIVDLLTLNEIVNYEQLRLN